MKDLRTLTRILTLLAASVGFAACDPGDQPDDPDDPPPEDPCTTWYPDDDGDGYGDHMSQGELGCERPTGTVDNKLDCDDTTRFRAPGHPEVCDGIDNDCNGTTEGQCGGGCDPFAPGSGSIYLICSDPELPADALEMCVNQGMSLVHINSQQENALLANELPTLIDRAWIGATDSAMEGEWLWVDNDENFWNGGPANATPPGAAAPGVYANWAPGFPDGGEPIDCAAVERVGGAWTDRPCTGGALPFICERTPESN